jgi:hypothetical protein
LNKQIARAEPSPRAISIDWGFLAATLLVGCAAFWMVARQYDYAQSADYGDESLITLNARVLLLEPITNEVDRDTLTIPLAAHARLIDATLDPHARVFVSGELGPTNASKLGFYYFLRNYLFPRDVDISLDGKAKAQGYGFSGVPCDSASVLKTNGYDLMVRIINDRINLTPLTTRGEPENSTLQDTNIETHPSAATPTTVPGAE